MVRGLKGNLYEEWLRILGILIPEDTEGRPYSSLQLLCAGKRRGRH